MKINPFSRFYLILCLLFSVHYAMAQTSGPVYVKAQLTASGVYNAPAFEYTTAYDSYNTFTSNGKIKGMFMEGLPYSKAINAEKRTKVFCWYGVPNGLTAGQKVPAVILVHGGGGDAIAAWVDKWMSKGYIAIALSLINKLPDGTTQSTYATPNQEYFFSDNTEALQDQWFYHAIGDVMLAQSLLRSSTFTNQVDTAHIGVTGISWGGINVTVLTGIDERLDFSIPVYGCGYLKESPVYSNQYSRMSTEAKDFYNANWRGELYTPLHKCPMLFVDGNKDLQFTLNIFDKTYDSSASPEKYLRIENNMGHGHAGGRAPEEIYDFADYVTGYRSTAIKPLEFTELNIDSDNNLSYRFSYTGAVNQAILYYSKDTLTWGKFDESFIWNTQTATLVKKDSTGKVTTTVPDDAQVYYVNINNTSTGSMFSSTLKYARRFYSWYDYGASGINTPIVSKSGGTLTTNITNPETNGINTTTKTNSFVKTSGANANLEFELSKKINDLSYLKNKLKVYLATSLSSVSNANIKLTYYNSLVGESANVSANAAISSSGTWTEYIFDYTSETIPADVSAAGGFDRVKLYFAPDDSTTDGTIYYFEGLKGTIAETYIKPRAFYSWLDYSVSPEVIGISKYRDLGGDYIASYNFTLDGIPSPSTSTNLATKFTKIPGSSSNTQIDYNFTDGILDDDTVTFKVRAFFKPETISEINTLETGCTGITLFLRNTTNGDNTQTSQTAYFTTTNQWEELTFTFVRSDLNTFDQLYLMFASGYASPIDEKGNVLSNEDFVYYIDYVKSSINLAADQVPLHISIVIEDESGQKLSGVTVNTGGENILSNQSGEASFDLNSGSYKVTVSKSGYSTKTQTFNFESDSVIIINMQKSIADVEFRVKDGENMVRYATIKLNSVVQQASSLGIATYYEQSVNKEYTYTIEKTGYKSVSSTFTLKKDTTINIQLSTITGLNEMKENPCQIYPNPADSYVTIETSKVMEKVNVLGLNGQLLLSQKVSGRKQKIEFSKKKGSMVFIHVIFEDGSELTKKINVQSSLEF